MKRQLIISTLTFTLLCFVRGSLGEVVLFDDQATFQAATGATSATGVLPDLGEAVSGLGDSETVGSVTFSLLPFGNNLYIGAGSFNFLDWYVPLPGHDIAVEFERFQVEFASDVFAMGFIFVEPNATMPPHGVFDTGIVDSTYEVALFDGLVPVGFFNFNAPDDVIAFVGVWSDTAFNRATIVDTSQNPDDEYFGEFFTSATQLVPEPSSILLFMVGLGGLLFSRAARWRSLRPAR